MKLHPRHLYPYFEDITHASCNYDIPRKGDFKV